MIQMLNNAYNLIDREEKKLTMKESLRRLDAYSKNELAVYFLKQLDKSRLKLDLEFNENYFRFAIPI